MMNFKSLPRRLAAPAIVAALAIAVPAVASVVTTSSRATTAKKRCFKVRSGGRTIRECLIPGPRGPRGYTGATARGLRGPAGPAGKRGATGRTGATGPTGPAGPAGQNGSPGTARAYATVNPGPTPTFASGQTSNFTAVTFVSPNVYCLTPAAPINAAATSPAVTAATAAGTPALASLSQTGCAAGQIGVQTYAYPGGAPTASNGVGFTVIVP